MGKCKWIGDFFQQAIQVCAHVYTHCDHLYGWLTDW